MKRSILDKNNCSLLLDPNGTMTVRAVGTSMEPTIGCNQQVVVRSPGSIRPGRCYLFRYNGSLVIHRLVARKNGQAFFWGDNSRKIERSTTDSVIGEVVDRHTAFFRFSVAFINNMFYTAFSAGDVVSYRCDMIRRKGIRFLEALDHGFLCGKIHVRSKH